MKEISLKPWKLKKNKHLILNVKIKGSNWKHTNAINTIISKKKIDKILTLALGIEEIRVNCNFVIDFMTMNM